MPRRPREYQETNFFHIMVQGEGFENLGKTKLNEILKVPYVSAIGDVKIMHTQK